MHTKETKITYAILTILIIAVIFLAKEVYFPSQNSLKKHYYTSQVATLVSPHSLREKILHGENPYVIVDTRDRESYINGHIVGAYNIEPGENMVYEFKGIQAKYPNKPILIYCYTEVCMRGRKVGKELAKNGIYVYELGIGFNEWKNFWTKWNYENEWETVDIQKYITIGDELGEFKAQKKDLLKPASCSSAPGYEC